MLASEGVITIDKNWKITSVNAAAERLEITFDRPAFVRLVLLGLACGALGSASLASDLTLDGQTSILSPMPYAISADIDGEARSVRHNLVRRDGRGGIHEQGNDGRAGHHASGLNTPPSRRGSAATSKPVSESNTAAPTPPKYMTSPLNTETGCISRMPSSA